MVIAEIESQGDTARRGRKEALSNRGRLLSDFKLLASTHACTSEHAHTTTKYRLPFM